MSTVQLWPSRSLADLATECDDDHPPNRSGLKRRKRHHWVFMTAWPQPSVKFIPKYVALWSRVFLVTNNPLYPRLHPLMSWLNLCCG